MLSSVEKLQKFFRLEVERGYDNRAVVGGLDKILPSWESEARSNHLGEEVIQTIITGLKAYPLQEPAQRAETLTRLMGELEQARGDESTEHRQENPAPEPAVPVEGPVKAEQKPAASAPRPRPAQTSQPAAQAHRGGPDSRPSGGAKTYPPASPTGLNAPVQVLQGVGSRLSQTLGTLGLNTLEDLLYYFPRRYDDYSQLKPINRLEFGEETTVLGTVESVFTRPIRGGKLQMTEAVVGDGTGFLRVNWFNQPWLAKSISKGTQVVLAGKIDQYMGRLIMTNPEMEPIETEHLHTNRIVPVYSLTARLNQKSLRRLMFQTITYWAPRVSDYLPVSVRRAVKLADLSTALANIHFPESQDLLDVARWRLAFDEIFLLQLGVLRQKRSWQSAAAQVFETSQQWMDEQISRLPFDLTGAQKRVLEEIHVDLASGRPMDRLIQGDVGSGKTVVAAMAIAIVTQHGAQASVMAPTSILAEQHYRTLSRLLAQPTADGVSLLRQEEIRLLIGDTTEAEKQEIRAGLESGAIKLVIGTHALIESPVQFQRLQLAVIDEQHRFGVAQRSVLRAKGDNPHLLVMTATPIPRSLALTVYGDLDLSVMDEMPTGRLPVSTHVLLPAERERAYQLIRAQVEQGHQAFIVYPLVEQGSSDEKVNGDGPADEEEAEPADNSATSTGHPADESQTQVTQPALQASARERATLSPAAVLAAVEEHRRLQAEIFPKLSIGLLHGRMKPEEKDQVMKAFRDHQMDILVSTTVVEVGVDIPNATVMLIEGANRFGLAQLHQLRGRVGRGSVQSFCLLIPDKVDAVENERLTVMTETNDGFILADRDLQQRGPGEFLGTRQAGFSELKMANLTDVRLIEKARQQAQALFQHDPELITPENQPLAEKLRQFWGEGRGDIS